MKIKSPASIIKNYPQADEELGEVLLPGEGEIAQQIADEIERQVRSRYMPGNAKRDVHSKSTGFAQACFKVNDTLPENLQKGIFIPGKSYKAYLRFSNSDRDAEKSDDNEDTRGLAVKLLGVDGEKILESAGDACTQDFVMINNPFFITDDPATYLSFTRRTSGGFFSKVAIPFALGLKGFRNLRKLMKGKIANPLQERYFSAVPYQLGTGANRQAIKFSVQPVESIKDPLPAVPDEDYLQKAVYDTLQQRSVDLKFMVQVKKGDEMSVENSKEAWSESVSPFEDVAVIHIPVQNCNTPELIRLSEKLSFNPWHSLEAHRPLGAMNRIRKVVYERISTLRNQMNGLDNKEPCIQSKD